MALTKCWECGETVSDRAEVCPHCGIKAPGSKPTTWMQGLDLPSDLAGGTVSP